ncbi:MULTISPECIES: Cof-type HAD-IIB family hydrolase [Bacillus]|jgi:phosphoglycolate phosphatase (TIGR01487 family)|uniref:Cof-type HAD-IIB family hydrolase n=1 Tax=Bacillus mojavensis TaxID=72360 RepID=A0AAP3CN49_BACMO|nr:MULTISPECIES: Cof-type HAD-IIB family hydrolase [Bacillus]MCC2931332.1 Cof-type HAD-IIB family hydrolase [Bacillus sp. LBG-1-113]MCY8105510.1 Cof-type HAD-IIB family hydrolase [Bacillus mojavensis]MCY8481922.1 Cof-type HAD-IIB family hydrolase [Bacillus mojavensis]MCY8508212.1 Cof-type HAD-IIB family hydrolase [Bacillus mojavensis]MCY9089458.1 Cof-type HAD-IIB family hydrolase [Bacillus mojavensis]
MSVQRENVDIKLIAIDMDGTLLNDEQLISDENRKAIREAEDKGVYVVISTGRTLMTCRELAESLELSSFLITANGSEIWDSNFNLVERKLLHTDHIKMMWDLRNKHNTNFWASTVNKVWRGEFPENITDHEWLKFGFDIEDDDIRNEVLAELRKNKELEITNSSPTNIEVNALGINKAAALAKVSEKLGFTMEHVMAMGDSLNDIAMIKEAGLGVAMGNAQDIVKETADWITDTNIEDGVAKAIRHWVL